MGAGVFSAWDVPLLDIEDFRALDGAGPGLSERQLRHLAAFSLLAPSTHNSVPQAYLIDARAGRIRVFLSRQHVLPASDPTGQQALASLGCAVENLAIAAAQYGLRAVCSWAPDLAWAQVTHAEPGEHVRIADIGFEHSDVIPETEARHSALRALRDRKVIRAEFDAAERLPSAVAREMTEVAGRDEGVRLHVFDDERQKFSWAKLDELAMKHKLEDRAFRQELGRSLLPNDDRASARGMRGHEFGIDDRLAIVLPAQLRGHEAMAGDLLAFMARASRTGLTSSSAVCVISCMQLTPLAVIAAGRAYQRCALVAFRHGFAHAVHTAVCEVSHARAMSKALLLQGASPAVIFRVGRPLHASDWERPHSSRPLLDHVLLEH